MKRTALFFSLFFFCAGALDADVPVSKPARVPPPASQKWVAFAPKLADSPFAVSYPENWFVREDPLPWKGATAVFISREPLKEA